MAIPFSLQDPLIKEAMFNLGLSEDDLKEKTLNEFTHGSKNMQIYHQFYNESIERRKKLISMIQLEKRNIVHSMKEKGKRDPSIQREKLLIRLNSQQLESNNQINDNALRRIVISKLRNIKQKEKGFLASQHAEQIGKQVLESKKNREREIQIQRCTHSSFSHVRSINCDSNLGTSLKEGANHNDKNGINMKDIEKDMNKHMISYQNAYRIKSNKYRAQSELASRNIENARKRSKLLEEKASIKKQEQFLVVDKAFHKAQQNLENKKKQLKILSEAEKIKAQNVAKKEKEIHEQHIQKLLAKIDKEEKRSKIALQNHNKQLQEAIQNEKERLKKQNEAAHRLLTNQNKDIDKFRDDLDKRYSQTLERAQAIKEETRQKLTENSLQQNSKNFEIFSKAKQLQAERILAAQQKLLRDETGFQYLQNQRSHIQYQKDKQNQDFYKKLSHLNNIDHLTNKTRDSKIKTIAKSLMISYEEAEQILNEASNEY